MNEQLISILRKLFANNVAIIGATSNAQYLLASYDSLKDSVKDDTYDNFIIENSANGIVNFSETNPFGQI